MYIVYHHSPQTLYAWFHPGLCNNDIELRLYTFTLQLLPLKSVSLHLGCLTFDKILHLSYLLYFFLGRLGGQQIASDLYLNFTRSVERESGYFTLKYESISFIQSSASHGNNGHNHSTSQKG